MELERFKNLTGLRGLFCLFIVLFHYTSSSTIQFYPFLRPMNFLRDFIVIREADAYVFYFYMLSGFVLCKKYFATNTSCRTYLKKRFFRIFPLHWFVLGLFLVFGNGFQMMKSSVNSFSSLPQHFFLVQNWKANPDWGAWNFPTWTLSSELFLYSLFSLFLLIRNKAKWVWWLVLSILLLSSFLAHELSLLLNINERLLELESRSFWMGTLLATISFDRELLRKIQNAWWQILALFFLIYAQSIDSRMVFLFALLILILVSLGPPSWLLSNRFFSWVGERSFSIYLIHIFVLELTASTSQSLIVLMLSLTLLGYLLHQVFELKLYRFLGENKTVP